MATVNTTATMSQTTGTETSIGDTDMQALACRLSVYVNHSPSSRDDTISLTYLTEGAANVVWAVNFHDSNVDHSSVKASSSALVLRMRKDIPTTIPMLELKRQFEEKVAPLFMFNPSLLLPVELVEIRPSIVDVLNAQLQALEESGVRPAMRSGIYHPSFVKEPHAMVLTNLQYGPGKVVEFKPKWLVQSPSAPRDAQRCRTCALNSRRRWEGGSGRGDGGFCPLDLLSRNEVILSQALRQIWDNEATVSQFVEVFRRKVQPSLRGLQQLQREASCVGLDDFRLGEDGERDFGVAMALRDCSVVIKVVETQRGELEIVAVKLLDLDLKHASLPKITKWTRMEEELLEEGWYTAGQDANVQCAMAFQ